MPKWDDIKAEYIRGGVSCRELAEKHQVSFSLLQKKCADGKWTDLRKKTIKKMEEKMTESAAKQKAKRYEKLMTAADTLVNDAIEKIRQPEFLVSPKDYESMARFLRTVLDVLGIKSEADTEEQKARIAKLNREAKGPVLEDGTVYGVLMMPPVMENPNDASGK